MIRTGLCSRSEPQDQSVTNLIYWDQNQVRKREVQAVFKIGILYFFTLQITIKANQPNMHLPVKEGHLPMKPCCCLQAVLKGRLKAIVEIWDLSCTCPKTDHWSRFAWQLLYCGKGILGFRSGHLLIPSELQNTPGLFTCLPSHNAYPSLKKEKKETSDTKSPKTSPSLTLVE